MEEQVERPRPDPPRELARPVLPPRPSAPAPALAPAPAPALAPAPAPAPKLASEPSSDLAHSLFPRREATPPELPDDLVVRAAALSELYAELELLGSGGSGVVVLARDLRTGEQVALKRLRRADDGVRFLREARTIAGLAHEGIVRLLRVVTTASDEVALALEHVPGPDLETLVRREGALAPARALHLARRVAEALAYAHGRGVVHRDVKPGNVLVLPDGRPKLTDFGLALVGSLHSLADSGGACGTLDYMAPEQRGDADRVDGRADVYGLGATLYRLLTGSSPRVIREGRIPEPARELVLRCVEEAPGERYASMQALIAALDRAEGRARADESSGSRAPLERLADDYQRRLDQAERGEGSRRLAVAAGGLCALGLVSPEVPGRLRARLELGEPWEPELSRLVAGVLEAAQARGREASHLLADAHALLSTALRGVPLSERGRQALRLLDRRSRASARPDLALRLSGALQRLIAEGGLDRAALDRDPQPGEPQEPRALLERVLARLRGPAQEAGFEDWPREEARWRRALDELGRALPEPELAGRLGRERLVLELECLRRETPS